MITSGSKILTREDGRTSLVEELEIGNSLYDPFSGSYFEIADIKVRSLSWADCNSEERQKTAPVCISKSALAPNLPWADVIVSPMQVLYTAHGISHQKRYRVLKRQAACELLKMDGVYRPSLASATTYYAIFTKYRQLINVFGLYLETLTQEVISGTKPKPRPTCDRTCH